MADSVLLSESTRTNLTSLQRTTDLIQRTQERLSTGKKVNSALDDALAFFQSRDLNTRASELQTIKSDIQQGQMTVETAVKGLEKVEDTLKQMQALAESAKSTAEADTGSRANLYTQFNELRSQIDHLVNDATYNGVNLIQSGADTLTVEFSEARTSATLEIKGKNQTASGLGIQSATKNNWTQTSGYSDAINNRIDELDTAVETVRDTSQQFGINSSTLKIREEFTSDLMSTLENGAAQLVEADMNEEAAKMTSLQTRQQLGTVSLSIAQQSQQSIMRLF